MTTWPEELKVNRSGYKETPPNTVMRSSMDTGPDKVRRRSTAGTRSASFNLFLTEAQLDIFDNFYVNECAEGANQFAFTSPRTETVVQCRFIGDAPPYEADGEYWRVPVSLEILP